MLQKTARLTDIQPYVRYANSFAINREPSADSVIYRKVRTLDHRLFYILSGRGRMVVDDEPHGYREHSLFLLPSGTMYTWSPDSSEITKALVMNFDYFGDHAVITSSFHPIPAEDFDPGKRLESIRFTDFPPLDRPLFRQSLPAVEAELHAVVRERLIRLPMSDAIASSRLKTALLTIARSLDTGKTASSGADIAVDVINYIRSTLSLRQSNAEIAAKFGLHPNYLSLLIRQYTGRSLHSYLIACRLAAAEEFLITTSLSVSEIGRMVGYDDPVHFNKIFKKHKGVPPSSL